MEKEIEVESDDLETVNEQSHIVQAVYTNKSEGKKKTGKIRVQAKSKSEAVNKAGVHLSRHNCEVHSIKHFAMEEVELEGDEVNEGKTYKTDPEHSFSSRVRNKMKKKDEQETKERASDKREVKSEE